MKNVWSQIVTKYGHICSEPPLAILEPLYHKFVSWSPSQTFKHRILYKHL